ncbi:MAG: elongation factor EF-2 [Nanoarchaeota archaeon]|nr:elongation factor EF-2 [Nanoarchaeota archaeon]
MADKETSLEKIQRLVSVQENIRNVATSAHIHHGKTAFTDNLLAAAGMMAAKNAGDLEGGMATWQHTDEQERLMTVDAANVSMAHNYQGTEYLINLIDTPGHVDFGGNVTRAMRAIDGTFVLICAVEGIMPQTETVLRQALKERVKPILFINKVDRLINELKFTPEQMQERFIKLIESFNHLIEQIAESEYAKKWRVNVNDGSVAFGSARENWALSIPFMKKKNVSFKDVYRIYDETIPKEERQKWVWENAALYEVVLDMAVKHLPNPLEAQKYRIPKIWHGEEDSEFGKSLINCNKKGEVGFVVTRIVIDPRSGKEICAGRLYSGTIKNGMDVYLNNRKSPGKIQQVLVYNGIKPEQLESVPAGNVLAISGIDVDVGETITEKEQTPFEEIKHIFQPVITKSIEVLKTADLPKLIEILGKVAKEDPSIKISINEETGESLISGMGELHLEIIENRIKTEKGLEVKTSPPIVVYRESVLKSSTPSEGRSPNKHNSFFIKVEPLPKELADLISKDELQEGRLKKKSERVTKSLSGIGWGADEIRNVKDIYKGNILFDETRGEVHIGEVIEMVMDAFEMVMDQGPLAREPCMNLKVTLTDIKLHEDAIHRGPAQVYPAVRDAIKEAFKSANPIILEPLQVHMLEVPEAIMGAASKLVGSKRGQLLDMKQEGGIMILEAKIPVAEMIGWASDFRSATEGRGISSLRDQSFERTPQSLQADVIKKIRDRKGLAENQ